MEIEILLASLVISNIPGSAELFFKIGEFDNSPNEFALAPSGAREFAERFPDGVTYIVGESTPSQFPFIHPSEADIAWGGKPVQPFRILFKMDERPKGDYALLISLFDQHERIPSTMQIELNGKGLPSQRIPLGSGRAFYGPCEGSPHLIIVPIRGDQLRQGENELVITLHDGSWVAYDALALARLNPAEIPAIPRRELEAGEVEPSPERFEAKSAWKERVLPRKRTIWEKRESGVVTLRNDVLELKVAIKDKMNPFSLRNIHTGEVYADMSYSYALDPTASDELPTLEEYHTDVLEDGSERLLFIGQLGSLRIEHRFTVASGDRPYIEEQVRIVNTGDEPLDTSHLRFGFVKRLGELDKSWDDVAYDRLIAIPYRREPETGEFCECYDETHGHSLPPTRHEHCKAYLKLIQMVKEKFPNVLIKLHDPIVSGVNVRYAPTYFLHTLPNSFDELWGYEYMWDPMEDLMSGRALSLYYVNLAYSIPIYLHIDLRKDNENALIFWWYASTCRHLGIGGKHTDPDVWKAHKRAMREYKRLKRFYAQGIFYGLDETVHVHTLPEERGCVLNIFNLADVPVEREVKFRLSDVGLKMGKTIEVIGASSTIDSDIITLWVNLPAKGHRLVEIR